MEDWSDAVPELTILHPSNTPCFHHEACTPRKARFARQNT